MDPSFRWGAVLVLLIALFFLAAPAAAQTFPQLTGRVVDQADLLRPEQELDLTSKSAALEAQSGPQFVVATVRSLEGRSIEDYGYRLGRHWGIGQEKRDDGVILLVAPNEKKVRIETGYGARVFLTDAVSSIIIRNDILPRFKAGDMAGGIMAGADAIIKVMSLPPEQAQRQAQQAEAQAARPSDDGFSIFPIVFWGMILLFVILPMFRRFGGGRRYRPHVMPRSRRRRRGRGFDAGDAAILLWGLSELAEAKSRRRGGWGGGWGGGGGFGGFSGGGGSFGGGGASGSW